MGVSNVSLDEIIDTLPGTPANVTVLPVAVLPKFVPLMVTEPPTGLIGPTIGERLVIVGVCARTERHSRKAVAATRRILWMRRIFQSLQVQNGQESSNLELSLSFLFSFSTWALPTE